jgi:hypothetical protein
VSALNNPGQAGACLKDELLKLVLAQSPFIRSATFFMVKLSTPMEDHARDLLHGVHFAIKEVCGV